MEKIKEIPLFSIIIPCYNIEKYISDTIISVLNQTYRDYEVILINDGSTDNTGKILNEYEKKDKRIRVIHQKNKGVSETRNIGIKEARGRYLYFLDGDDSVDKNILFRANEVFNSEKVECLSFGYKMIYKDGKIKKNYSNDKYNNQKFSSRDFLSLFLYKGINQHICSFIIEKKIIEENNLKFNSKLIRGEDIEFQIKLLLKNYSVFYLSYPFFKYCIREGSAVQKQVTSNIFEFLNILEKEKKLFFDEKLKKEYFYYFQISFFYIIKEIADKGYENNNIIEVKNYLKKYEYILEEISLKDFKIFILKSLYKINLIFLFFRVLKFLTV